MKIFGLVAAALTSSGFIPQLIRAVKTKKLDDISTIMLLIVIAGTACWIIYGVFINDIIIVAANSFTCTTVILLLWLKYYYR